MTLPRVRGHSETLALLGRAAAGGDLAQSILLHGAAGIGKERVGLWSAQLLLCESPSGAAPCGDCLPCRLVLRLEHPDVHWFFPVSRPDASSPEKLREKLEEQRSAELQARRADPHHVPVHEKPPAHFLASIQTIQQLASVRPAMGRRKAFIVGDAELMVPQESSPEAANAFLKLLEEPPPDTVVILTSSQPGALLPTIRSRVLPLRMAPVPEEDVRGYLQEEMGLDAMDAARIAGASSGAIGRAIRLAPGDSTPGSLAARREAGRRLLLAALSPTDVPRLAAANERPPAGARGEFQAELDAFAEWLRHLLALASGAGDVVHDGEARALLERVLAKHPVSPLAVARAIEHVGAAHELAMGNVNPQLITADVLRRVQAEIAPRLEPDTGRGRAAPRR